MMKFRVWTGKEMKYTGFNVGCDGVPFHYQQYEGRVSRPEWVLMQFTGLQDKNGKEIYEGDLLMVKDARICEVVFHSCAGCWDLIPRNIISSLPIGAVSPASYQYHTEVIGNIYENPELLK